MTYLEEYYEKIKTNEIIVGYYLETEIENLIEDLQDERYIYDTLEAHKRIKFIETCALQSKAPFYNKPVKLLLFQKAFLEVLYSFKMRDTGLRRFNEALLLIARKNGKSTLMAADALYDLFVGAGGNDICCASNDDNQARLIWSEIAGMTQRLDPKKSMCSKNLSEIRNFVKNNTITRLSSKTNNKDGRNYSKVYLDESHDIRDENASSEIAEACWRSMSTKEEPLFINCTTNGFNRGCYLDKKIETAKAIIEKKIDNPHFLPFLFLQDTENEIWADENSWFKSNPALNVIKKNSKLKLDIETAQYDAGSRIHLLCKDFNITTSSAKSWLNHEDYTYAQEPWDLDDFRNGICIGACDFSMTTDLTNVKLMFLKPEDENKYVYSHYWIPEAKLERCDDKSAGADYKTWIKQGFISICDGADNDIVSIAHWLLDLKKKYGIRALKVYYDQRYAKEFIKVLDEAGVETELIQQNKYTLSTPTKLLEAELKNHNINFNNNPVDIWNYSNAALEVDSAGRQQIVKMRGTHDKRIDGAVTGAILMAGYQRIRNDFERLVK